MPARIEKVGWEGRVGCLIMTYNHRCAARASLLARCGHDDSRRVGLHECLHREDGGGLCPIAVNDVVVVPRPLRDHLGGRGKRNESENCELGKHLRSVVGRQREDMS